MDILLPILGKVSGTPTKEELFISALVCKELNSLGDTGKAIINDLTEENICVDDLPSITDIDFYQNLLGLLYSDKLFNEGEDGISPNWIEINKFDVMFSKLSFTFYNLIQENITQFQDIKLIENAILDKDKKYFVNNFDIIFKGVPGEIQLVKFKNFLKSDDVSPDDQEYMWEFFESLLDLFLNPLDFLDEL